MIETLVVEDDPILAEAHRLYTERIPGFRVAGVATLGAEALRLLSAKPVDLILLDVNLPDMTGLELCRTLRARGNQTDVIAVTSSRDLATVRTAVSLGVVQYLIKPFQFATFRAKLDAYAEYRRLANSTDSAPLVQDELDRMLDGLRTPRRTQLPRGLSDTTLAALADVLRSESPLTASELAERVGVSAPTTRRYLDYLTAQHLVSGRPRYGGPGRPETLYRWDG